MAGRILVDLLGYTGRRGGTETYAREIIGHLPAMMPGVDLVALTGRAGVDAVREFFPGEVVEARAVGADRVSWAAGELLLTDRAARRCGATLIWAPANFGPIRRRTPRAVTIHDVIYDEVPGSLGTRAVRNVTAWLMRRSALTADAVLTVSHTTAAAVADRFGIAPADLHVVPNGSSDPHPVDAAALAPLGLDPSRQVVLSTGNRMPHKRFDLLLAALARIPLDQRPLAVITGGGDGDPLPALARRLGIEDDVVFPGWVSAAELEALYARADVYACPSAAEGFGLPVVDALRRGCRVVANDIPVLREVGGDAARYADAADPDAFAAALASALATAPSESDRAAWRDWAAQFTWEASARGTAAVLQHALDRARDDSTKDDA